MRIVWVDVGPPTAFGSRKFQPAELLNAGIWAAAFAGITSISGDLATETPVAWIRWAPSGKPRAMSTHKQESGIQAWAEGSPLVDA